MTVSTPVRPTPVSPAAPRSPLLWAALAARVVLGVVLAAAALPKLLDPTATVRAVRAYRLLPDALAVPFAHALPAVELVVAVLLLAGLAVRLAATVSAALLLAFTAGIAGAWARGLSIDCGCFGGGGQTAHPHYLSELVRDALLLVVAVALARRPDSRWALSPAVPTVPEGLGRRERVAAQRRHDAAVRVSRRILLGAASALAVAALTGVAVGAATTPAASTPVPRGATAAGGIVVGRASAPHLLVAYEDPQFPVCGRFEQTSGPALQAAVAAGTVRVEYRMRSFLGPESVRAVAALGAAADEGRFGQLRERLFATQPQEHTGGYTVASLLAAGRAVGLDSAAYQRAVRDQTYAGWARRVDDQASRDGDVGTPELRLDGTVLAEEVVFDPQALAAALR